MTKTRKHDDFTTPPKERAAWHKPGAMGHTIDDACNTSAHWCRIHRYPEWSTGHLYHGWYPGTFHIPSGKTYIKSDGTDGIIWDEVMVYCGPGAFYPPRGKRGK